MRHSPPRFAARLAPLFAQQMPDLVQRLTTRLQAEVEHYATIPTAELAKQAQAQLQAVLRQLAGEPDNGFEGPASYGKLRAEQGVPLEVVLHAYRVAWAELWAGILEAAQRAQTATTDELLEASSDFFWMADDFAGQMVAAYRRAAIEILLRQQSERSATLEGVFSGYLNGAEKLWEAAAILDLPYEGHFYVVVAEPANPGREALPGIKEALREAGIGSAWRLSPDIEAGIISLRHPDHLPTLLHELRASKVRVGLSPRYTSLAGTPHALHLARLTLAALPPTATNIGQFDESPIAALIAASPKTAHDLVQAVFGEILHLPTDDREMLLTTLHAWFEASGSTANTAEKLFCHANTVRYRIHRLEKYIGRTLESPIDVADIRAALVALRVLPQLEGY